MDVDNYDRAQRRSTTPLREISDRSDDETVFSDASSAFDTDGDGDEYIDSDEAPVAGPSRVREEDAVFTRLAGYVSKPGALAVSGEVFRDELAAADQDELPETSRTKRRKGRPPKPNIEVDRLLGRANLAFVQGQHNEAVDILREVIRLDPHVRSAYTTLASCYEDLGDKDSGRQMRFVAAHLDEEADTWKELASEFKSAGEMTQCLYCLRKAYRQDTTDIDTLWELASIYRSLGQNLKAINTFRQIFKTHPHLTHNFDLLMDIYPLVTETKQYEFGASIFRPSFDWHIANHAPDDDQEMSMDHITATIDLLLGAEDPETAIQVVRRGQRWLQGRSDESHWDQFDDDREYDPEGFGRDAEEMDDFEGFALDVAFRYRLALARLHRGQDREALIHVEELLSSDVSEYHSIFLELGQALMKREQWRPALDCLSAIQSSDALPDDTGLIFSIGVCHHQLKEHAQAIEALRWVVSVDETHAEAKLRLASVLEDTGNQAEALEIVTEVLRSRSHRDRARILEGESTMPKAPTAGLSRGEKAATQKLNKRLLEVQSRTKMQSLWQDVRDAELGIEEGDVGALNKFVDAAGMMVETYRLAPSNFTKSRGISRIVKNRKHAGGKDLTAQALAMQDRLERVMGFEDETPLEGKGSEFLIVRTTDFYGISSEDWLMLTIKYCCVLMAKLDEELALDILEHVLWSGLFFNKRCEVALRLTIIACAMRMNAYDKMTENCRRLSQIHQFRADPLLMLLACLGGGHKAHVAWQTLALQKFIHRELRLYDEAASGYEMSFSNFNGRWTQIQKIGLSRRLGDTFGRIEGEESDDEDYEGLDEAQKKAKKKLKGKKAWLGREDKDKEKDKDEDEPAPARTGDTQYDNPRPTKRSPALNAIYGQHMLSAKSYQSALFYLFRAYEQNEYDPFLCLSIAQAFFGRAMNRQSDNRNYQIAQGMAFLMRYRKLSSKDLETQEEVEYNYGRSFHGLGVPHLAIVHYERVLDSVKKRMEMALDPDDVRQRSMAFEAAHNLMLLYATVGNTELVKQKSEWLAI